VSWDSSSLAVSIENQTKVASRGAILITHVRCRFYIIHVMPVHSALVAGARENFQTAVQLMRDCRRINGLHSFEMLTKVILLGNNLRRTSNACTTTPRHMAINERTARLGNSIKDVQALCQRIPGGTIDEAMGKFLVGTMTPLTLEVALAVQKELESRGQEIDRLRLQEMERSRYRAELARRRFMNVDPDNRLVAASLEAEWNHALRALADAKGHYEKQSEADRAGLSDAQRAEIAALAQDFPRLWNDPHTPQRERKRMARLLIADVTLLKDKELRIQVRFNGGTTHTLTLPLPKPAWMLRQTLDTVVKEIDRLLDGHTDEKIAELLNSRGMTSGEGKPFSQLIVRQIRMNYELESRYSRLRARGMLSLDEIAAKLGVCCNTIKRWRRAGLLLAHRYDDRDDYLFEGPGPDAISILMRKRQPRN
jgi:hypothetical protein